MISVNKEAKKIVDHMVGNSDKLNIDVLEIENGTTILDCGIEARGGMQAGKLLSEICMGGLGEISFTQMSIADCNFHAMNIVVDQPLIGCMASQYAGWSISVGKFFALGSGPARALALREKLFEDLKYKDESDVAILVLETSKAPEAEVADYIAEKCGVESRDLYILVAPCASVAGSIQISARLVETGMHKMHEIGFDIGSVVSGFGVCPIAPIAKNDLEAMGRTNDCILYGGRTWYNVDCEDKEIEKTIERVP
ncbi:MAG: methenyltetrahydromethanopterin cyclohydrolase, partial [Methanocellales archaeon]|nr:methenyltetrahydromethanopterin cyclohydrolase [Methanocellales archaeon]